MSEAETASVKGREISVKKLNEMQMMLFAREYKILKSDRYDQDRKVAAIGSMMDILESAVVEDDDRDWLVSLAAKGELALSDLMDIATPKDKADPVKPVRRAARTRR